MLSADGAGNGKTGKRLSSSHFPAWPEWGRPGAELPAGPGRSGVSRGWGRPCSPGPPQSLCARCCWGFGELGRGGWHGLELWVWGAGRVWSLGGADGSVTLTAPRVPSWDRPQQTQGPGAGGKSPAPNTCKAPERPPHGETAPRGCAEPRRGEIWGGSEAQQSARVRGVHPAVAAGVGEGDTRGRPPPN